MLIIENIKNQIIQSCLVAIGNGIQIHNREWFMYEDNKDKIAISPLATLLIRDCASNEEAYKYLSSSYQNEPEDDARDSWLASTHGSNLLGLTDSQSEAILAGMRFSGCKYKCTAEDFAGNNKISSPDEVALYYMGIELNENLGLGKWHSYH